MADQKVDEEKLGHLDYKLIPLRALNVSCRRQLSLALLPERALPTSSGIARDWQGLCELAGFSYDVIKLYKSNNDPVAEMLEFWAKQQPTIADLVNALEMMDRFDIIEDISPLLEKDAIAHIRKREREGQTTESTRSSNVTSGGSTVTLPLTVGDVIESYNPNGKTNSDKYDAYVSYMDSDSDFVAQMVEELEGNFNLRLFIKDRDMLPGVVESEADICLINERCEKILLIVSEESLTDPQCEFHTVIAQAAAVDKSLYTRKIIPIICKPCVLPQRFKYLARLDYTKKNLFGGFWGRLYCSIKSEITDGFVPTMGGYNSPSPTNSPEARTTSSIGPLLNLNSLSPETCANRSQPEFKSPGLGGRKSSLLLDHTVNEYAKQNRSPPVEFSTNNSKDSKLVASTLSVNSSRKQSLTKSPLTSKKGKLFNTTGFFGRKTSS